MTSRTVETEYEITSNAAVENELVLGEINNVEIERDDLGRITSFKFEISEHEYLRIVPRKFNWDKIPILKIFYGQYRK